MTTNNCASLSLMLASMSCDDLENRIRQECSSICGPNFASQPGTWGYSTRDGNGYYRCPCCSGEPQSGIETTTDDAGGGRIDFAQLPWYIWVLLVAAPAILLGLGYAIAPKKPAYKLPMGRTMIICSMFALDDGVFSMRFLASVLQAVTGYLVTEKQPNVDSILWRGTTLKEHVIKSCGGNTGNTRLHKKGPQLRCACCCFACSACSLLRPVRANVFFDLCVNVAIAVAFAGVQFQTHVSCSNFCTLTENGGSSSSQCSSLDRSNSDHAEVSSPSLFSADTCMSALFYTAVSTISVMGAKKFIESGIACGTVVGRLAMLIVLVLGVSSVVSGVQFISGAGGSGAEVGIKCALVLSMTIQNLLFKCIVKPLAIWLPASLVLKPYVGQLAELKAAGNTNQVAMVSIHAVEVIPQPNVVDIGTRAP
jgi:hypothetical protein